eukprot:51640-Pelagomonas_calceolata.AAC.8
MAPAPGIQHPAITARALLLEPSCGTKAEVADGLIVKSRRSAASIWHMYARLPGVGASLEKVHTSHGLGHDRPRSAASTWQLCGPVGAPVEMVLHRLPAQRCVHWAPARCAYGARCRSEFWGTS